MGSSLKEGLLLGVYGMLLTMFILFLLGAVIYLFKFIFKSSGEEEELMEPKDLETSTTYMTNKKMIAISVALAKYFSREEKSKEERVIPEVRYSSLKEKRWKNG